MSLTRRAVWILALVPAISLAQPKPPEFTEQPAAKVPAAGALQKRTWTVNGVERTGLLHIPANATKSETPIVFAFHGHGGSARQASMSFHMHTEWPEAIVVYMEGLPTPSVLVDPDGKKNGWQNVEGVKDDRDLKFFDAVLESLKKDYKVDERRIYAMGHSNGGGFTYLLWKTRASVFAAFAPSGAFTLQARSLAAKPAMHIAGKTDELVKFPYQERTIEAVKKINGCEDKGTEWAKDCVRYESKSGTPLITFIYDGGHKYPSAAPAQIVRFFKEQAKPVPDPKGTKPSSPPGS